MPGKMILVVDNEEDQRRMMKKILGRIGYEVRLAADGQAAIALTRDHEFHFIILDLIMPDMEGPELCERIKETSPRSPIYALSGYIELYDEEKLKRAGFDGLISKPVRIDALKQLLDAAGHPGEA